MDKSSYALFLLFVFLGGLLMVPRLVRWVQSRQAPLAHEHGLRVLSAIAIGPQHKVVVVALGGGQRLVLGVAPQSVSCLHTLDADRSEPAAP